jgi:hypothetical protein
MGDWYISFFDSGTPTLCLERGNWMTHDVVEGLMIVFARGGKWYGEDISCSYHSCWYLLLLLLLLQFQFPLFTKYSPAHF